MTTGSVRPAGIRSASKPVAGSVRSPISPAAAAVVLGVARGEACRRTAQPAQEAEGELGHPSRREAVHRFLKARGRGGQAVALRPESFFEHAPFSKSGIRDIHAPGSLVAARLRERSMRSKMRDRDPSVQPRRESRRAERNFLFESLVTH